jgi:phosphate transport system permease protein
MHIKTRKVLDRTFTGVGAFSILLMGAVLVILLGPIIWRGSQAYIFKGTIEFRKMAYEEFQRGSTTELEKELAEVRSARAPVYRMIEEFDAQLDAMKARERRAYKSDFRDVKEKLSELLGPFPGEATPILIRQQYGATRRNRAREKLHEVLYKEDWVPNPDDPSGVYIQDFVPRVDTFKGTALEPMFGYLETNFDAVMQPRWTFYWQFIKDKSIDSHIFGGIGPEVLGTLYLTLGAILFAVPMGIIAAIYLCEYARPSRMIDLLRTCISTLAGVPSIVFGLFGLAFFLNTIHVSDSKSVLAGSLTLSLMILPTVIRASEEAILAVPRAYKEAAFGLGAGRWYTITKVILPAALPGILTGVVISMGRAAGETAPIIFTAAVSLGEAPKIWQVFSQPTPALPWNIYNLSTEHEAVHEIRHVQFGMVLTLVALVLLMNLFAVIMRARISKKLKG